METLEVSQEQMQALIAARSAHSVGPEYDEVLYEVASRIDDTGSVGKTDIGALLFWKRLRANTPWVPALMTMSERKIRGVTEDTVRLVRDEALTVHEAAKRGRVSLGSLPGFVRGDALASAVLLACAPQRMAVYDTRAHRAMRTVFGVELGEKPGRYGKYMSLVTQLMASVNDSGVTESWIPRDVDLALFMMGQERD